MTNAELIAKIKAEIERRTKELNGQIVDIYDSKAVLRKDELQKLLSLLSDLEKLEKPIDGLEEEIIKCWQEWVSPSNKQSVEGVLPLSEFAFYARHFAEWGAEHPKK